MNITREQLKLYVVTDRSWLGSETLYEQVEKALKGGVTLVQLREKNLDEVTFEKEGGLNVTVNYYPYDSNFYLVTDSKGNTVLVNKMKVKQMLESFDAMVEEWNQ